MPSFIKKALVVEAHQLPEHDQDPDAALMAFLHDIPDPWEQDSGGGIIIHSAALGMSLHANPLDWIIRDTTGAYYPCPPEAFDVNYAPADPHLSEKSDEQLRLEELELRVQRYWELAPTTMQTVHDMHEAKYGGNSQEDKPTEPE